nr:uncharacterized protein LOC104101767 [Ipomoea batatas]
MSSNVTGQQPCLFSEQASPFLSITSDLLFYFAKSPLSILSQLAAMGRITPTDLTLHKLSLLPFSPTVFITILAILAVLSTLVLLCGAHRALTSTRGNNVEQKKKNSVRLGGKKPARLHITSALSEPAPIPFSPPATHRNSTFASSSALLAGPWRSCDERLQTSSVSALFHLEETWAIPPESKSFWASVLAPPPMASLLPQTSSLFLSPTTHAQDNP